MDITEARRQELFAIQEERKLPESSKKPGYLRGAWYVYEKRGRPLKYKERPICSCGKQCKPNGKSETGVTYWSNKCTTCNNGSRARRPLKTIPVVNPHKNKDKSILPPRMPRRAKCTL